MSSQRDRRRPSYLARLETAATALVLERSLRALRRMGVTVSISIDDPTDRSQ
jgi:hypothetical protein